MNAAGNQQTRELNPTIKGLKILALNKEQAWASKKVLRKEQQKAMKKVLTLVSQVKELLRKARKHVISDFYFCREVENDKNAGNRP
jgi:hypothetical protein